MTKAILVYIHNIDVDAPQPSQTSSPNLQLNAASCSAIQRLTCCENTVQSFSYYRQAETDDCGGLAESWPRPLLNAVRGVLVGLKWMRIVLLKRSAWWLGLVEKSLGLRLKGVEWQMGVTAAAVVVVVVVVVVVRG